MLSFEDALSAVLQHARPASIEMVDIERSPGYVLAEPVIADADSPLFDNSAMDGFGVRVADVQAASPNSPVSLAVSVTVCAGDPAEVELPSGSAVKIMTGGCLPSGVEAVVMREACVESDGWVLVRRAARPGENIRYRGEEFKAGDEVLPCGIRITPPVVGLLVSLGRTRVRVYRKPRVAVIVTGSELMKPGEELTSGCLYDSNSYALSAALRGIGIDESTSALISDDREAIKRELAEALDSSDVVIAVGGVSVGDYDYVKEVCAELNVSERFWRVAIKPGKPFYFGTLDVDGSEKLVFGLPGNPVAALVTFYELVKPALLKTMGQIEACPLRMQAVLTSDLRKKPGRLEFTRGIAQVEDGRLVVRPTSGQGSHMLAGLAEANCVIFFPASETQLPAGSTVWIEFLEWKNGGRTTSAM